VSYWREVRFRLLLAAPFLLFLLLYGVFGVGR
jgi:hypothetical protein